MGKKNIFHVVETSGLLTAPSGNSGESVKREESSVYTPPVVLGDGKPKMGVTDDKPVMGGGKKPKPHFEMDLGPAPGNDTIPKPKMQQTDVGFIGGDIGSKLMKYLPFFIAAVAAYFLFFNKKKSLNHG